jgi:HEAT repeat protein
MACPNLRFKRWANSPRIEGRTFWTSASVFCTIREEPMLRYFCILLLVIGVAGCDPAAPPPSSEPAARAERAKPRRAPSRPVAPATKPVARVQEDFPDLAAAQQALLQAFAANDAAAYQAAERWLVGHGDAALGSLAAVATDETAELADRIAACRALPHFGEAACPALQQLLTSPLEQVQVNAIRSLSKLSPVPESAVGSLLQLADKEAGRIRIEAIRAIGELGPSVQEQAAERLLALLNDQQETDVVRDAAKQALEKVSPRRSFVDP